jgi:caffeoyl-CoA O-methyltransferase
MSRTNLPLTDALSDYMQSVTLREPEPLKRLREGNADHPKAGMQTAPDQGQFLYLLAKILGARKTLEVGVFMGYSSTWVANAIGPGGKIVACDISEEFTKYAREAWRSAGVEDRIELRLGPALETLDRLIAEGQSGTFDFAFIDADKKNYSNYFERAMQLVRTGGVIATDNVLWDGRVADPKETDEDTEAIRAFNTKLHADARITLSIIPLGDGLTVACKL